jgi:uncharacterized FlaG/YvyC family protein
LKLMVVCASNRLSATCLVFRANVSLLFQSSSVNDDLVLNVSAEQLQSLVCYRAKHLILARLKPPPAPVFEPLNISLEYKRSRPTRAAAPSEQQANVPATHRMSTAREEAKEEEKKEEAEEQEESIVQDLEITLSELNTYFSFLQISSAMTIVDSITRSRSRRALPFSCHCALSLSHILFSPSVVTSAMPSSKGKKPLLQAAPLTRSSDEAKLQAAASCLEDKPEGTAQTSALFAAFQVSRSKLFVPFSPHSCFLQSLLHAQIHTHNHA